MGVGLSGNKIMEGLKKYRYPILILLIGFVLMSIPMNLHQSDKKEQPETNTNSERNLETKLSETLSQMHGAGKVEVVLTRAAGEEVVYQTNLDTNSGTTSTQTESSTVTITDSSRNQSGLIRQIIPEQYLGAIILCQGADDPIIRLAIVDAVSKATGLGANKISVLKLK